MRQTSEIETERLVGSVKVVYETRSGSDLNGGSLLWSDTSRRSEIYAHSGFHTFDTE